jgi:hypothetical protein
MEDNKVRLPIRLLTIILSIFLLNGVYNGVLVTWDSAFPSQSLIDLGLDSDWVFVIISSVMVLGVIALSLVFSFVALFGYLPKPIFHRIVGNKNS